MSKHYLIDGYNLLFRLSEEPQASLECLRSQLIEELVKYGKKDQLTVVFDGMHAANSLLRTHYKDLELVYTETGQSADEQILEILNDQTKKPIIVTSDKKLAKECKRRGAQTQSVESFLKAAQKRSYQQSPYCEKNLPAAPSLFQYYLKAFEKKSPPQKN